MKKTGQWIVMLLILIFMAGCENLSPNLPDYAATPGYKTPVPGAVEAPNPASDAAQATIDFGQRQLSDLAYQATQVSLNIDQAANAAAQLTQEVHQRQQLALDYQSTQVSLNITQAALTQEAVRQQRQNAEAAIRVAQNSTATAAQAALVVIANQTAQAQATVDARAQQTQRAVAALTAYPQTATPLAKTQAALLMQQYDREQQSFIDKIVVPAIPYIVLLEILLVMYLFYYVYRRTRPWFGLPRPYLTPIKLIPISATIHEHVILHSERRVYPLLTAERTAGEPGGLAEDNMLNVEIMDAAMHPVARWVADVEVQLANHQGFQQ